MGEPTPCPNSEQLGELLAGRLPEQEQATLAEHLDTCENCRKTLEGIAGGDELVPGRAAPPDVHQADQEAALQDVMAQLKADVAKERTQADQAGDDTLSLDFLEPSDDPDHLGRFGPYEVTEVIGRGGMGVVLKGFDPRLHRFVAVKVMAPQLASHATARRRFQREARAAAAVSHDHVITIHAVEEAAELPYLVMEYVCGVSLQERIDRGRPLDLKEILRIGAQAASGLAAAHAHGVIHRDIKPANILLEDGVERVKITDFGLARAVDDVTMTQTGVVAGTPQYMSPEQARGDPVDHRSDLFSLGSVLYAMCTGRPPFRAETTMGVIRRVCEEQPRLVRDVNQELPEWLAEIIHKLMAKDPDERFQSAAEVADLLGQHLAHLQQPSVVPRPPRLPRRPSESAGRSIKQPRLGLWLVAIVLLLVCALGLTEVTGVTKVSELVATVLRIRTPHGTLVVEVEDPQVTVDVEGDGETITLSGLGPHEIRLRPGRHQLRKTKDGVPVGTEWVTVTRGGKRVVKVELQPEADQPVATWLIQEQRFSGLSDAVRSLAISSDGRRVLSGCGDGTMYLWDAATGERIRVFPGHTIAKPLHVAIGPNGRKAASSDWTGIIRLWNLETGEKLAEFQSQHGGIYHVEFSRDGNTLLSTGCDKTARIWRVQTGDQVQVLEGHRNWVSDGAFSPDGRIVVTASFDGTVRLWDASSGKQIREFEHPDLVKGVAFSPDGRLVVSGGNDGIVRVFETDSGNQVRRCVGHTDWIQDVQFSADGRWVISGSYDRTLRIWDVQSGRELVRHESRHHTFNTLAVFPDGRHILSAGGSFKDKDTEKWVSEFDYDIRIWRLPDASAEGALSVQESLNEIRRFEGHVRWITGLAFFDDGGRAVSASRDTTLRTWNVETGEELVRIDTGTPAGCVALSPDETAVAASDVGGTAVHLWDLESGKRLRTFDGHTDKVVYLAFSPDGKRLLSSGYDRTVRLWDVERVEEICQFELGRDPGSASCSADGRLVAGSDPEDQTRIWDVEGGDTVHLLKTIDTGMTLRSGFSLDGRQLVTGSAIGVLRLWEVASGNEIRQFPGHDGPVVAVVFSFDGRHIISGGIDSSLRVWEIASGREVARIRADTRRFDYLAISPDGRHLITGGGAAWRPVRRVWEPDGDYAVHLYRLPESVWPKEPDVGPAEAPPPSEENAGAPPEVPGDPDESVSDE